MSLEQMKSNKYVWMVAGLALGLAGGYVIWGMNTSAAPAGGNAAA